MLRWMAVITESVREWRGEKMDGGRGERGEGAGQKKERKNSSAWKGVK